MDREDLRTELLSRANRLEEKIYKLHEKIENEAEISDKTYYELDKQITSIFSDISTIKEQFYRI